MQGTARYASRCSGVFQAKVATRSPGRTPRRSSPLQTRSARSVRSPYEIVLRRPSRTPTTSLAAWTRRMRSRISCSVSGWSCCIRPSSTIYGYPLRLGQMRQQLAGQLAQLLSFAPAQARQHLLLVGDVLGHEPVYEVVAGFGQLDGEAPAIFGIGYAPNQTARLELVEAVGHGPGRDQRRIGQAGRREPVRGTGAKEREEDVGLPHLQVVLGGLGGKAVRDHAGQVQQARDLGHAAHVEVGAHRVPLRDERVDLIGIRHGPRAGYLDIKKLCA